MAENAPASPRQRWWIGAIFVIAGFLICLLAAGVFKSDPRSVHAPMWLIGMIGAAFSLAGATVMLGASVRGAGEDGSLPSTAPFVLRFIQYLMGLSVMAALAVTGTWVAFGPGERHFNISVGGVSGGANDLFGRIVFGGGTILTWLCFALIAIHGARKLLRNSGAPPSA